MPVSFQHCYKDFIIIEDGEDDVCNYGISSVIISSGGSIVQAWTKGQRPELHQWITFPPVRGMQLFHWYVDLFFLFSKFSFKYVQNVPQNFQYIAKMSGAFTLYIVWTLHSVNFFLNRSVACLLSTVTQVANYVINTQSSYTIKYS